MKRFIVIELKLILHSRISSFTFLLAIDHLMLSCSGRCLPRLLWRQRHASPYSDSLPVDKVYSFNCILLPLPPPMPELPPLADWHPIAEVAPVPRRPLLIGGR